MTRTDLLQAMDSMEITLTEKQAGQFCTFADMLLKTNAVMNLTAITDSQGIAVKHMADSLSCYDEHIFTPQAKLLDLGTGAGFPGMPLAIYRPDLRITFFDSLQKRLLFLQDVAGALGINASFLHGRAEDMAHMPAYRSQFDIVTSRAVARLPVLAEWALPYVRTGGYFIALKGSQYEEEMMASQRALAILGGVIVQVRPVSLPGVDGKRAVLYIKKTQDSPAKYPRKPKMAAKHPL